MRRAKLASLALPNDALQVTKKEAKVGEAKSAPQRMEKRGGSSPQANDFHKEDYRKENDKDKDSNIQQCGGRHRGAVLLGVDDNNDTCARSCRSM